MNNDAYRLHFPSVNNDDLQRLMDGAHLAANRYRWLLRTYTAEEEKAIYELRQARAGKVKPK